MIELKICRICLRTECKVYKYDRFQLKSHYEEVTSMKLKDKDGLPHYFCYECAALLHKFHKFKEKCYIAFQVLKEISGKGRITYDTVDELDKEHLNLNSPLDRLIVTKQVRTFWSYDDDTEVVKVEKEVNTEQSNNLVNNPDDRYSDNDNVDVETDIIEPKSDHEPEIVNNDDNSVSKTNNDKKPIKKKKKENKVKPKVSNTKNVKNATKVRKTTTRRNPKKKPEGTPQKRKSYPRKKVMSEKQAQELKEDKRSFTEYGLKAVNPNFAKKRTKILDDSLWEKIEFTEEEAISALKSKAMNSQFPYECKDCYKGYRFEDILTRHRLLVHSEKIGKFECRLCHQRFKIEGRLRQHLVEHFTRYKCLQCFMVIKSEEQAYSHQEYHKGVTKTCEHCGDTFKHMSTYYTHLRMHRSEHVCNLCGASFVSPLGLHQHKNVKHIGEDAAEVTAGAEDKASTYCDKCEIRFETRLAYAEHLRHSARHVDDAGRNEQSKEGTQEGEVKTYQYKKKRLTRDGALKLGYKHKKPTICHQCGKQFETQSACMKHHAAEHPHTSFYPDRVICEICGASLALGSVKSHENTHTRKEEYACHTCARVFYTKAALQRHLVTHTGEKPYKCPLCEKRFTQSGSRMLHYRTYHLKEPYPKRNRWYKKKGEEE